MSQTFSSSSLCISQALNIFPGLSFVTKERVGLEITDSETLRSRTHHVTLCNDCGSRRTRLLRVNSPTAATPNKSWQLRLIVHSHTVCVQTLVVGEISQFDGSGSSFKHAAVVEPLVITGVDQTFSDWQPSWQVAGNEACIRHVQPTCTRTHTCLSYSTVCLSVCLLQASVLSKRLYISSPSVSSMLRLRNTDMLSWKNYYAK